MSEEQAKYTAEQVQAAVLLDQVFANVKKSIELRKLNDKPATHIYISQQTADAISNLFIAADTSNFGLVESQSQIMTGVGSMYGVVHGVPIYIDNAIPFKHFEVG